MTSTVQPLTTTTPPQRPSDAAQPNLLAAKDIAPFALALIPFGLAIGNASATAGLSATETMFGAVVLLAGAGQLAATKVIGSGGGPLLAASMAALVDLRFIFYGGGVARWFADESWGRRMLLAFPIVDQTFLLCEEPFQTEYDRRWRQTYYLPVGVVLGVAIASRTSS